MKKIFFKLLDYKFDIDKEISIISIENPILYRSLSLNIYENIIYSINDTIMDLNKHSLIILNPFNITLNETKLIKYLYKDLEKELVNNEAEDLSTVETYLLNIVEKLSINTNIPIDYSEIIDINKLLSSLNIKYKECENYLETLVYYIKLTNEIYQNTIIISFGLLFLLEKKEIELLKKELKILNINLIDIQFNSQNNLKDVIIDDDWCLL